MHASVPYSVRGPMADHQQEMSYLSSGYRGREQRSCSSRLTASWAEPIKRLTAQGGVVCWL